AILAYWSGDERSMDFSGPSVNDFPMTVTIGAHCTHAVGVGYALKLRGEGQAALCSLGDGASSKGDFYEGINAAGVWDLPLVYLVTNNGFAISLSLEDQTACETLAQKGIGAGIKTIQVDGNDILATRYALEQALEHARDGKGAILVEAVSYRLHDHTTADDSSRYRNKEEVDAAWRREPIGRFKKYLMHRGLWDEVKENALQEEAKQAVETTVQEYLNIQPANPGELLFDHLYETLPKTLHKQRDHALKWKGGSH
ncbi:MAG: thiamine pyrophosphate-dependent enzyme, partial [Pirellulales bacterium]|nr:thiamine pyrophosphate-dependent enzyme [Pirellulales bacterium]